MAARRRQLNSGIIVVVLIALAVFLWLAQTMEGFNFDTVFIALFCTLMCGFVARCAQTLRTGR